MSFFVSVAAMLPAFLNSAAAAVGFNVLIGDAQLEPQADLVSLTGLEAEIAALSAEDREDLFVFVAGNTLHTLYHEGGHMLISELELPVLAQEENAVDNLATVSMLADDSEDTDVLLIAAMVGWFMIAEQDYESMVFYDEHDLNVQRGYQMLCLMVGADEEVFEELAIDLELPEERMETCAYDYELVAESWEVTTEPFWRDEDLGPAGKIKITYDKAPEDLKPFAIFLKESELMERVAREFDSFYELPETVTFRAGVCEEENAFWDPSTREVIICYELLAGFAAVYLDDLAYEDPSGDEIAKREEEAN